MTSDDAGSPVGITTSDLGSAGPAGDGARQSNVATGDGMPGGRLKPFSPERYYATFRCEPSDGGALDEDLFLVEEPLPRVEGRGLMLGNRWYWDPSEQLARLITGPAGAPKRKLLVRYDRALFAAGVLEEVLVVEVVDGGQRVPRVRCGLRDKVLAEVEPAEFLKWRREYERRLRNSRELGQETLLRLQAGQDAVARWHEETAAQHRRRSSTKHGPAAPVIVDTPTTARQKKAAQRQQALENAARGAASAGTEDQAPEAAEKPLAGGSSSAEPTKRSRRSSRTRRASGAARRANGATTGIATHAPGAPQPSDLNPMSTTPADGASDTVGANGSDASSSPASRGDTAAPAGGATEAGSSQRRPSFGETLGGRLGWE